MDVPRADGGARFSSAAANSISGPRRRRRPSSGFLSRPIEANYRSRLHLWEIPTAACLCADFESVDWLRLGREIEQSEHFPNRTNVEFVRLVSKNEIEVRFWERGVGHTMSSGTGSCGATVAAILNGLTERRVRVRTEAGTLEVAWPEGGEVTLTGPAVRVMTGKLLYAMAAR